MNDYIFIEQVPEQYIGHEIHPIHVTIHVKESMLIKYRGAIESEILLAINRIEAVIGNEACKSCGKQCPNDCQMDKD